MSNRMVKLARRPRSMVTREDFTFESAPVPEPGPGELRVRVEYISLDPAMRGWMNEGRSYVPPVALGEVMRALGGIPTEEEICSQFTGNQDICVHHDDCGLKPVWTSITDFVNSVFDRVPISTLLTGSVDVKFVQITSRGGGKEPVRARPAA